MNIRIPVAFCALLLAAGGASAQMKVPSKPAAGGALGSGINIGSPPASTPSTAAPGSAEPGVKVPSQTGVIDDKQASAEDVVQEIANCVMAGLPPDWSLAQIEVREISRQEREREFEAIYTYKNKEGKAGSFTPCDPKEPAMSVYKLNGALEPSKRNWVRATLVFSNEGKFELQYDYLDKAAEKAPAATPAPASAAKKDAKKAPAKKNPG
jgi:hypothetical protein